ncbi:MAG TPA: dihydroorotase [Methanosarcinales archaeon]|nr:dihydroorotase [Methanosarcinales archaeon]
MSSLLIKNSKLWINGKIQAAEILIENGKIIKIAKIISTDADRIINVKGNLVLPGAIDVHVHFRDPGMTHKEDWYTGSYAAACGGVTTVIDMPNTIPPTTTINSFIEKLKIASEKSVIDFGINAGVTRENSREGYLKKLWKLGATAFKIFMAASTGDLKIDPSTIKNALSEIGKFNAIACVHAEDESMSLLNTHPISVPNISESSAIENIIIIAMYTLSKVKLHICHVSTRQGVRIIKATKHIKNSDFVPIITSEVTPHHLFLSQEDLKTLKTFGKMNPPLRSKKDITELWKGLNDGTIDIVASDHAPHLPEEKETTFFKAPSGVPGVETLLPLMLYAVKKNLIQLETLVKVISENPAKIFLNRFNKNKGFIKVGFDADLVIVDMAKVNPIKADNLHSRAGWTPFENHFGIFPVMTIIKGNIFQESPEKCKGVMTNCTV